MCMAAIATTGMMATARAGSTGEADVEVTLDNMSEYGLEDIESPPCDGGVMVERRQTCDGGPETCHTTSVQWDCPGYAASGSCSMAP